jgi:hypothetical protein
LSIAKGVAKTGATLDSGARHPRIRSNFGEAILGARARLSANRQRGQGMAEQEMKAANETYAGFLSMLKIGTIITVVVAAFVVLIIS